MATAVHGYDGELLGQNRDNQGPALRAASRPVDEQDRFTRSAPLEAIFVPSADVVNSIVSLLATPNSPSAERGVSAARPCRVRWMRLFACLMPRAA
jgi:hypothetical protein